MRLILVGMIYEGCVNSSHVEKMPGGNIIKTTGYFFCWAYVGF